MVRDKEMRAVFETLIVSVRTGLNASLTPSDCKILLSLLNPNIPRRHISVDELIDGIYANLSTAARKVINEITNDVLDTKRRRRK